MPQTLSRRYEGHTARLPDNGFRESCILQHHPVFVSEVPDFAAFGFGGSTASP